MPQRLLITAFFIAAFMLAALPVATAQSSYTGSKEGFIGSSKKGTPPARDISEDEFNDQVNKLPRALPPVFDSVRAPTNIDENGYAVGTANDDPCAAYLDNYNGYTVCQDRIQKIEKMKAGKERRKSDYGTRQAIRPSEQRRLNAEKAAADKIRAEEEAKEKAEKAEKDEADTSETAATDEKSDAPKSPEKRVEDYQKRKDDYIQKKSIGLR